MSSIIAYFAAIADSFAATRMILIEGWYGDYDSGPAQSQSVVTIQSLWVIRDLAADAPESIYYGPEAWDSNPSYGKARMMTPRHTDASNLPAADSPEALKILTNWMGEELDNMIEDGGATLLTEDAYNEAEAAKRFKELELVAKQLLAANPNRCLFEVLEAQRETAEDRIYGLQEDGLCAVNPFSAGAVDDYYELRNEYGSAVSRSMELFDFCTTQFPLSYLAWQEARAVEEQEELAQG